MKDTALGTRDKRGFWRPSKKLNYGPFLVWPFRVWFFLIWLLGYPVFILPLYFFPFTFILKYYQ